MSNETLKELTHLRNTRSWEEFFQEIILQNLVSKETLPPLGEIIHSMSNQIAQLQVEIKSIKESVEKLAIETSEVVLQVQSNSSELATIRDLITVDIQPIKEVSSKPLTKVQQYLKSKGR